MKIIALLSLFWLAGCAQSSVKMVNQPQVFTKGSCSVTVYPTKATAEKAGAIDEICVVSGGSHYSFDHTIDGAIKKNIKHVCACGANKAYIQSQGRETQMGLTGASYVTLIGFRHK